jgi:hypothetical protein
VTSLGVGELAALGHNQDVLVIAVPTVHDRAADLAPGIVGLMPPVACEDPLQVVLTLALAAGEVLHPHNMVPKLIIFQ